MGWTTVCDLPMKSYQGNQALDTTDYSNNADILGSIATHSGYVSFQGIDAQLEIPVHDDSLAQFAALRVQALVRPAAVTRRYNIAEGWMSFAFFIESDGRLIGTIYDGQSWLGPDSGTTIIPPDTWSRVAFEYDGISIAKLTLNGSTVGSRLDMSPGIYQPQQVITLGHWPRGDGRYTLQGDLGHVRIERRNHEDYWRDALHIALCRRRLTPLQADAMREIRYLGATLDPEEREQLLACIKAQSDRVRVFLHELRAWSSGESGSLQRLARRLRAAWCCSYNAPAIHDMLLKFFRSLAGEDEERFRAALEEFFDIGGMCAREGYPYDRIRELCLILWPELRSFEADLRELAEQV